jgi:hypothetical protein
MCDRQECELKIKVITKSDEEPYITGMGGTMATGLSMSYHTKWIFRIKVAHFNPEYPSDGCFNFLFKALEKKLKFFLGLALQALLKTLVVRLLVRFLNVLAIGWLSHI